MKIIKTGLLIVFTAVFLTLAGCATDNENTTATTVASDVVPALLGSKWHYADEQWEYDIEFAANGVMHTTHPNDKTTDNDSWEQDGVKVKFYFNNKFSQYQGTLSGNNAMSGTASNSKSDNWTWKATRVE
jgi:outer membrane biogenesis lipoprotein LolB